MSTRVRAGDLVTIKYKDTDFTISGTLVSVDYYTYTATGDVEYEFPDDNFFHKTGGWEVVSVLRAKPKAGSFVVIPYPTYTVRGVALSNGDVSGVFEVQDSNDDADHNKAAGRYVWEDYKNTDWKVVS